MFNYILQKKIGLPVLSQIVNGKISGRCEPNREGNLFMSEKHPECPLYNPLNCKEYYNPQICAFVRKDKICQKKKKPKAKEEPESQENNSTSSSVKN